MTSPGSLSFVMVAMACAAVACGGSSGPESVAEGAGGEAPGSGGSAGSGGGAAGGPFCGTSGVTKGPWVVAVDETTAKVRWETCAEGSTAVRFAPEQGGDASTVDATASRYDVAVDHAANRGDAPHDLAGPWIDYEAALSDLTPATCYAYSVADDDTKRGRFCTARAPGDAFRFLAIGETSPGLGETTKVLASVLPRDPDFTLHVGDLQFYAGGVDTWASWFPPMQPLLSAGAFFPAVGNHDHETVDEYEAYFERFFGGAGFDETNDYFRFHSGGVWFFVLNTELPYGASSDQGKWLDAMLADATMQPGFRFPIVVAHEPFVTCGDVGDHPAERAALEPIFRKYGVKLVLQGHTHGYERFDFGDLAYVTTGGGGATLGNVDENASRPYCGSDTRVASGAFFHAVVLDVGPGAITGTVVDEDGTVRDGFALTVP